MDGGDCSHVPIVDTTTGESETIPVISDTPIESALDAIAQDEHIEIDWAELDDGDYEWFDPAVDGTHPGADETAPEQDDESDSSLTADDSPTPDEVLRDGATLYERKNDDYGAAWRLAGETMALWAQECGVESMSPQDAQQMVSLCLYIQRLHKLVRTFNLEFNEQDPSFEKISESHSDNTVYASMHTAHSAGMSDGGEL